MKYLRLGWLLLPCFTVHFLSPLAHAIPAQPRQIASSLHMNPHTVRVKLSSLGGSVLTIHGTDLALSLAKNPELGSVRSGKYSDEWVVDCKRNLIIDPSSGRGRTMPQSGVLLESLSGVLTVNERRFREQIVVYPHQPRGKCLVVNHINVEQYLESVVNGEFNSQWAESAVEAQIIAARTYALYQMKERRRSRENLFDVESTQKDQVYLGMDRADSKAAQLVARTRGMILIDPKSKTLDPIKSFYHASCGGGTVLPQEVWGSRFAGINKRVACPFCADAPSFRWSFQMSFREIQERILRGIEDDPKGRKFWPNQFVQNPDQWILMGVKTNVPSKAFSKEHKRNLLMAEAQADENEKAEADTRVDYLNFEFADRDQLNKRLKVKMNAYHVRNWLDPSRIKSTLYQLEEMGRSVIFRGKGSGHGVGMCQWGAKKMGEKGYSREKILSFYYPGVKISRIW